MISSVVLIIQKLERKFGEILAKISSLFGRVSARLIFHSQWGYSTPEWFDHRLHLLDPEKYFNDYWAMLPSNVLLSLPLGGKLLNLCSGDGFYDYYFYRKRAQEIECVDFNREAYSFAVSNHSDEKISYVFEDVLTYEPLKSYYDTVCIRGAIEHFSEKDQQIIIKKSYDALKPGGFFCGDTPAKKSGFDKQLPSHEFEWKNEIEMKNALSAFYLKIETWSYVSADTTMLFWRCQK